MLSRTLSGWRRLLGQGDRAAQTRDEERRLWGRLACDLETSCRLASGQGGTPLPARVLNISRGGISLDVPNGFEPGSLLSVALPVGNGTEVLACVVRCEPKDGRFELGCTFAAQLSDEDLQHFGARREPAGDPDQRNWVRYPCHARAEYQVIRAGHQSDAVAALVLNISASGIAMQVEQPLQVGELLNMELSREGVTRLTILASVVRTAIAPDGARVVGCNFIRELPEEQLLAFQ